MTGRVAALEEVEKASNEIMGKTLITPQTGPKGKVVKKLYVEEGSNIEKEFYISMVIDRETNGITVIASTEGGMEIEEVAKKTPEKIIKHKLKPCADMELNEAKDIASKGIKEIVITGVNIGEFKDNRKGFFDLMQELEQAWYTRPRISHYKPVDILI